MKVTKKSRFQRHFRHFLNDKANFFQKSSSPNFPVSWLLLLLSKRVHILSFFRLLLIHFCWFLWEMAQVSDLSILFSFLSPLISDLFFHDYSWFNIYEAGPFYKMTPQKFLHYKLNFFKASFHTFMPQNDAWTNVHIFMKTDNKVSQWTKSNHNLQF